MSTAHHLHQTAAGVAFVRCPDCRQPVTLAVDGGAVLRLVAHDAPDGEACPASGAALGKVNGGCGKEQGHEQAASHIG